MFKRFLGNWAYLNLAIAALACVLLAALWGSLSVTQRFLMGALVFINLHFVEEFIWPGGFQIIGNTAEMCSPNPTYEPLNQLSAFFGNNFVMVFAFLLPIVFPDQMWLVLTPAVFAILEVLMHFIFFPVRLGRFYNPGLVTTVGLAVVMGAYLVWAAPLGIWTGMDWLLAALWAAFNYVFSFHIVGRFLLKGEKWAFTEQEIDRYRRIAKKAKKAVQV